jgi:hypothetical protein
MRCSHLLLSSFDVNIKFLVGRGFHALHPVLKYTRGRNEPPHPFRPLGYKSVTTQKEQNLRIQPLD